MSVAPAPPPRTEGLDTLDRHRAASLADEGGAAAASLQADEPPAPGLTHFLVGLLVAAGLAAAILLWLLARI